MEEFRNLDSVTGFELAAVWFLVYLIPWALMIAAGGWILAKLSGWRRTPAK